MNAVVLPVEIIVSFPGSCDIASVFTYAFYQHRHMVFVHVVLAYIAADLGYRKQRKILGRNVLSLLSSRRERNFRSLSLSLDRIIVSSIHDCCASHIAVYLSC